MPSSGPGCACHLYRVLAAPDKAKDYNNNTVFPGCCRDRAFTRVPITRWDTQQVPSEYHVPFLIWTPVPSLRKDLGVTFKPSRHVLCSVILSHVPATWTSISSLHDGADAVCLVGFCEFQEREPVQALSWGLARAEPDPETTFRFTVGEMLPHGRAHRGT